MKLSYKVMSTAALVAVMSTAAITVPVAAEAELEVKIDSVIVSINGENILVSLYDYTVAFVGGNSQLLTYLSDGNDSPSISFVEVGGKTVELNGFVTNFAIYDGDMSKAAKATPETVVNQLKEFSGFNSDGSPKLKDVIIDDEFQVLSIAAITETGITVTATPFYTPTAADFNVSVGGVKVDVTGVTLLDDGSFLLAVNLDGKKGELTVNGFKQNINFVTKLSVVVDNKDVASIEGASSTTIAEVLNLDEIEGLIKLLPDSMSGVTLEPAFLVDVKTAIKNEFLEVTGKSIREVTLADVKDKEFTIAISGAEVDNSNNQVDKTFVIKFQSLSN